MSKINEILSGIVLNSDFPVWIKGESENPTLSSSSAVSFIKEYELDLLESTAIQCKSIEFTSQGAETPQVNMDIKFQNNPGRIYYIESEGIKIYFFSKNSDESNASANILSLVSHELKTPMISIQAFFQLLEGNELDLNDESGKMLLTSAMKNVNRLISSFEDILNYKKSSQNTLDLVLQEVDPRRIFLSAANQTAEKYGGIVDSRIQLMMPSELPTGIGDRSTLEQAVKSFFEFAWNSSPKDAPLMAKLSWVELENKNQVRAELHFELGNHISEEISINPEKLFQPFSHIEKEDILSRHQDGIGMNLALSKELLEKSGGNCGIEFEQSENIKKLKLWLELPLGGGVEDLKYILDNRIAQRVHSHRDLSLLWLSADSGVSSSVELASLLKSVLHRSTDASFPLASEKYPSVAAVLEDCKLSDRMRVEERVRKELKSKNPDIKGLRIGGASYPEEAKLVERLFDLARDRMR